MKKEEALRKIKACWARAESDNEAESARALSQALALMRQFDLDNDDVLAADVNELKAKSGGALKPAEWEAMLASACGRAFGCEVLYAPSSLLNLSSPAWVFIGVEPATTQSQYAFIVLFRRCGKARSEHIKTKLKRCKPATKTARGNQFAEGWVQKVVSPVFQLPKHGRHHEAIEAYLKKEKPALGKLKTRSAASSNKGDRQAGHQAGNGVEWTCGLGAANEPKKLTHIIS